MKIYIISVIYLFLIANISFSANRSEESKIEEGKIGNIEKSMIRKLNHLLLDDVRRLNLANFNEALEAEKIDKCLTQTALIWEGESVDFLEFCRVNFIADPLEREKLFDRISENMEILNGNFNEISLNLKKYTQLNSKKYPYNKYIDDMFASFEPSSHLTKDLFANNFAHIVTLNFQLFSLEEKLTMSKNWTKRDWAKARLVDMFTQNIDAEVYKSMTKAQVDADNYISNYYIYMGNILSNADSSLFPKDMKLISHWNLRDEIKSNYAKSDGIEKQKIIYNVMTKIINQDIPKIFINNPNMKWKIEENILIDNNKQVLTDVNQIRPEKNERYEHILNNFKAVREVDSITKSDYITRKFNGEYEIKQADIEALFIKLLSSEAVPKVAELIKKRLGRDLQPFDIWYDGFKTRSSINEDELNKLTKKLYKNENDVQNDLVNILKKLGFEKAKADFLASKVTVEPSKGAGHAWGAQAKWQNSYLRTRIEEDGMDYKGYNIAIHEFGHNVEQTFSLHNVSEYLIAGVPNNAFTEAIAFLFQLKDLEVLGLENNDKTKEFYYTLDNFWSTYEIMGVALTDQYVWKWLYENPNANAEELKIAVNNISKNVWNKYYAPIFGIKDQNILAIYSHSIDYPLYLSAYPLGHLIEFQLDTYIKNRQNNEKDKLKQKLIFAQEVERISSIGRLLPNVWMNEAVGEDISVEPLIKATINAVKEIEKIKK